MGKIEDRRRRGWQRMRWLDAQSLKKTLVHSEGQGSLVCCSPWSCKVSDTTATEQQQWSPWQVWEGELQSGVWFSGLKPVIAPQKTACFLRGKKNNTCCYNLWRLSTQLWIPGDHASHCLPKLGPDGLTGGSGCAQQWFITIETWNIQDEAGPEGTDRMRETTA